jgi:pimeloyl-ACP methyl ester carboxylesterase
MTDHRGRHGPHNPDETFVGHAVAEQLVDLGDEIEMNYATLMGNDLVRFIDAAIERPTLVAGLSSGGVLSAWLSAYARPGQVVAAVYEDPPLFASEVRPAVGPGIRQCIGPLFHLWSTSLGDQWSIGAWDAMRGAAAGSCPGA